MGSHSFPYNTQHLIQIIPIHSHQPQICKPQHHTVPKVTQVGTVFASHRITQLPRVTQCHFLLFLLRLFFLDFDSPSPSPSVSEDDEDEDEDEDEEDEELSDSLPDESLVEDEDDEEELLLLLLLLLSESESDELLSLLELSPSDL